MTYCRYCYGGYCQNENVRHVMLRSRIGGPWDSGTSWVGTKCRRYLRGHFKYIVERDAA